LLITVFIPPDSPSRASEALHIHVWSYSKPLQNDQKIVLNRIQICHWDYIYSPN